VRLPLATIDKDKVEARLRERADEIAKRLHSVRGGDNETRDNELADYDQHPADTGSETFTQELDETTAMILEDELKTVQTARDRLAEGKYGICIDGGEEIEPARLEAQPEAIRCMKHQRIYEGEFRARGNTGFNAS
jgi:RNA polymerase-binding transcription factor DksA